MNDEITQPRWIGDQHRPEGDGWTGVTVAQKDWSAGRMYVQKATGRLLSRTQSALLNANTVADLPGAGYWTGRYWTGRWAAQH
jgi:hypothetical protein